MNVCLQHVSSYATTYSTSAQTSNGGIDHPAKIMMTWAATSACSAVAHGEARAKALDD
jgi:hypothetical protein